MNQLSDNASIKKWTFNIAKIANPLKVDVLFKNQIFRKNLRYFYILHQIHIKSCGLSTRQAVTACYQRGSFLLCVYHEINFCLEFSFVFNTGKIQTHLPSIRVIILSKESKTNPGTVSRAGQSQKTIENFKILEKPTIDRKPLQKAWRLCCFWFCAVRWFVECSKQLVKNKQNLNLSIRFTFSKLEQVFTEKGLACIFPAIFFWSTNFETIKWRVCQRLELL